MNQLIAIQLETDHENANACSFYAYFKGDCVVAQVLEAFDNEDDERVSGGLSPFLDDGIEPVEVPTALSKATDLRRFFVCGGC